MSNRHLQSPTQPSLANIKANNFRNIYLGKNKGISGGDLLLIWQGKCLFNSFLSHLFKEKKNPIPSTTRKCYPRQYTTTYRFSYFDYASQYTLLDSTFLMCSLLLWGWILFHLSLPTQAKVFLKTSRRGRVYKILFLQFPKAKL